MDFLFKTAWHYLFALIFKAICASNVWLLCPCFIYHFGTDCPEE